MCWQDVQISRQTVVSSVNRFPGGASGTVDFVADVRRVRFIASASNGSGPMAIEPDVQMYIDGKITANQQVLWQDINDVIVIDIKDWGEALRGKVRLQVVGDGVDTNVVITEMCLYDPLGLGEPMTQTPRG